jgi:rubrerythrin
MSQPDFFDALLLEINDQRSAMDTSSVDNHVHSGYFSDDIIKHWLSFAVYYERAAVSFIGEWLRTVSEVDALHHFTHQIEDECNHFRWLNQHLIEYSGDYTKFSAPAEWSFLMDDYYPKLNTLIERLAAHNIAAETGALGFLEYGLDKFPPHIRATVVKVAKDEKYHVSFGLKLLRKYCVTDEQKQLARKSALESMNYMKKAREVFCVVHS